MSENPSLLGQNMWFREKEKQYGHDIHPLLATSQKPQAVWLTAKSSLLVHKPH